MPVVRTECLLALLLVAASLKCADTQFCNVTFAQGTVQGITTSLGSRRFLGIPFAEAPVAAQRFQPPIAKAAWTGVLEAIQAGPSCVQTPAVNGQSEDCLHLNVFSPPEGQALVPVNVWIHGGGFIQGDASELQYFGDYMVGGAYGCVVVSLNYRLGVLGFHHDTLLAIRGNMGLLDQQLALQWVQQHIAAFGGDPTKVMVFGESAGAASVGLHLTMPSSAGLFRRATMQSNGYGITLHSVAEYEGAGYPALARAALNCTSVVQAQALACVQNASVAEILAASATLMATPKLPNDYSVVRLLFAPLIDGTYVIDNPLKRLVAGAINTVEGVLLGSNANESSAFYSQAFPQPFEFATFNQTYDAYVRYLLSSRADAVLRAYPAQAASTIPDGSRPWTALDFVCSTRAAARALSAHGVPTFLYNFQHAERAGFYSSLANLFPSLAFCANVGIVCHGAEMYWVFHSLPLYNISEFDWTATEDQFSRALMTYWNLFSSGADNVFTPNAGAANSFLIPWPRYHAASDLTMILDMTGSQFHTEYGFRQSECDFWDATGIYATIASGASGHHSTTRFYWLFAMVLLFIGITL